MNLSVFIRDSFFSLPINCPDDKDFNLYVENRLNEYLQRLKELAESHEYFDDYQDYSLELIIERQTYLIKQIKKAISHYFEGNPASAFKSLAEGLNSKLKNYEEVMYVYRFIPNSSFYRIRIHKENFPLPTSQFFHIPFEQRGKVKTQRYSIPGFPSLYLGTTVYVCWEEMGRPNRNDFQIVRLKNTESIRVLNLVPPLEKFRSPDRLYKYLMLWPIIFTSSIKVNNPEYTFKPEYIIPQLLLQWVRSKENIDGILYRTTHIDFDSTCSKGEFHNIVLPVRENKANGLCDKLKQKFEMTSATSIQLNELSNGGIIDGGTGNEPNVDEKIQELEIIKGRVFPYSHSLLGELESTLLKMETRPI